MAQKKIIKSQEKNQFYFTESNIHEYDIPDRNYVARGSTTSPLSSSIKIRPGFNRYDKDRSRPEEVLPQDHSSIILAVQSIYKKIGFVRNIIDLMADFASDGLELQHPIKSQERFYKQWAEKVNLKTRTHDFIKLLLRDANVIVRRKKAKIPIELVNKYKRSEAFLNRTNIVDNPSLRTLVELTTQEKVEKITDKSGKTKSREIPWRYVFMSPVIIEKISGEVGRFFGSDDLGVRLTPQLKNSIKNPKSDAEKEFISKLPEEIIKAAQTNSSNFIALDMDRIYIDYYKKDDWEDWATPFLYGVLEDILFKDKMRQADMAALDGVINTIRIWKLGKSDQKILPTPAAVNKLLTILEHNIGGGTIDIVWDDMINLQVEYPPTDKILGADKYQSVDRDIVRGLGIPDSLIGGADLSTRNSQTAFVQLKTLTERLEYVRDKAMKWIQNELRLVADAMGFTNTPRISFGIMSLRDEAAEKKLMIQLLDRNIISMKSLVEVFGMDFVIELQRLKDEESIRMDNKPVIEKAGPYYRPISLLEQQQKGQERLALIKSGSIDDGGDNPSGDLPRDGGNNDTGRPPASIDTETRDERTEVTLSTHYLNGIEIYNAISKIIDPIFLSQNGIKNIRSLTKDHKNQLFDIKMAVMANSNDSSDLNEDSIKNKLSNEKASANLSKLKLIYDNLISKYINNISKDITVDVKRSLVAEAWCIFKRGG